MIRYKLHSWWDGSTLSYYLCLVEWGLGLISPGSHTNMLTRVHQDWKKVLCNDHEIFYSVSTVILLCFSCGWSLRHQCQTQQLLHRQQRLPWHRPGLRQHQLRRLIIQEETVCWPHLRLHHQQGSLGHCPDQDWLRLPGAERSHDGRLQQWHHRHHRSWRCLSEDHPQQPVRNSDWSAHVHLSQGRGLCYHDHHSLQSGGSEVADPGETVWFNTDRVPRSKRMSSILQTRQWYPGDLQLQRWQRRAVEQPHVHLLHCSERLVLRRGPHLIQLHVGRIFRIMQWCRGVWSGQSLWINLRQQWITDM